MDLLALIENVSGFGNKTGEHWLHRAALLHLSTDYTSASQDLKVYRHDATDSYRLLVSGYSGTAGDAMGSNSGARFTTKDHDNDGSPNDNCASSLKVHAWWYDGHWLY